LSLNLQSPFITGKMPQSGKLLVLCFTFTPQGWLSRGNSLHRFTWNLAWPRRTQVRLAVQNFMSIGAWGWVHGPQSRFPLFGKDLPLGGKPLHRFVKNVIGFYAPNCLY